MRNAKRFLALVLSVLMLAGCFSIAMGATVVSNSPFADVEEYSDAINLLTALNVIKGKTEDEYGPADAVARNQMAIFLARATSGWVSDDNAEDQNIWKKDYTTSTFTDLTVDDYMGAIDYCFGFGYINGRSATEFDPKATVTFQEALTMCVRALGYDTEKLQAGYPWTYIQKAIDLGLDEELEDVAYTKALTRAETAQLMKNFIFAVRVNPTAYRLTSDSIGLLLDSLVLDNFAVDKLGYTDNLVILGKAVSDGNKKYVQVYDYDFQNLVYKIDYDRACELFCDIDPETNAPAEYDVVANAGRIFEMGLVKEDFVTNEVLNPVLVKEIGVKTIYQNAYDFALGAAYADKNIAVECDDNDTPDDFTDDVEKIIIKNDDGTSTTYVYAWGINVDEDDLLDYNKVDVYDGAALNGSKHYYAYVSEELDSALVSDFVYKANCYDFDEDGDFESIVLFTSSVEISKNMTLKAAKTGTYKDAFVLTEDLVEAPISLNARVEFYYDAIIPALVIIRGAAFNADGKYVVDSNAINEYYNETNRITGTLYSYDAEEDTFTVKVTKVDRNEVAEPFFATFNYYDDGSIEDALYDNISKSITFKVYTNLLGIADVEGISAAVAADTADFYFVTAVEAGKKIELIGFDSDTGAFISAVSYKKANILNFTEAKDAYLQDEDDEEEFNAITYTDVAEDFEVGDIVKVVDCFKEEDSDKTAKIIVAADTVIDEDDDPEVPEFADFDEYKADFTKLTKADATITVKNEDEITVDDGKKTEDLYVDPACKVLVIDGTDYELKKLADVKSIENNDYCNYLGYLANEDDEVFAIIVETVEDRSNRVIDDGVEKHDTLIDVYVIGSKTGKWDGEAYEFDGVFSLATGGTVDDIFFATKYAEGDIIAIYETAGEKKLNGKNGKITETYTVVEASEDYIKVDANADIAPDDYDIEFEDLDGIYAFTFEDGEVDYEELVPAAGDTVVGIYEASEETFNYLVIAD